MDNRDSSVADQPTLVPGSSAGGKDFKLPGQARMPVGIPGEWRAGEVGDTIHMPPIPRLVTEDSVRDVFAGQALAGILSNPVTSRLAEGTEIARRALKMADAMMVARAERYQNDDE